MTVMEHTGMCHTFEQVVAWNRKIAENKLVDQYVSLLVPIYIIQGIVIQCGAQMTNV